MSTPLKGLGAITLFTEDLGASKAFYEGVFDLSVIHEDDDAVTFDFGNTMINVLKIAAAHELIDPASTAGADVGSRMQLTIWVDDVDAVCARLEKRGITLLNGPMDREWGVRTACFQDPSGHVWEVARQLDSPAT